MKNSDFEYMRIAIDISKKAKYPYGAIVVKDGKIIGRSDVEGIKNETCYTHPEFVAIQSALKNNNLYGELEGSTMYVSCEPCPMCMGAILYEKFDKLVYGATLEDSDKYYCEEILISCETIAKNTKNRKIEIVNIMREEAVEVLKNAKK
jgi:tRNA(Arg) A34 adenosine deaminase TadA